LVGFVISCAFSKSVDATLRVARTQCNAPHFVVLRDLPN
jgi:hypothetical protein